MLLSFSTLDLSVNFSGTIDWSLDSTDNFFTYSSFLDNNFYYLIGITTNFEYNTWIANFAEERAFITKKQTSSNFSWGSCEAYNDLSTPYFNIASNW